MKYAREIKVAVLAAVALFVLFFGFQFLKGVNIFHATNHYYAVYPKMNGLIEQAPVYIKGYRVGQVDAIAYDFQKDDAFVVSFSISKDIRLPQGTEAALIADGLLSGEAIELRLPCDASEMHTPGDTLSSMIEPSLFDNMQTELLGRVGNLMDHVDSLVVGLDNQLIASGKVEEIVDNLNVITTDFKATSRRLRLVMDKQVPTLLTDAGEMVGHLKQVSADLEEADLKATVQKVDSAIDNVNALVETINSENGTIGLLLNNKDLYLNLNNTVQSADSLLTDLKAHPKRYVHFSLFGKKEK